MRAAGDRYSSRARAAQFTLGAARCTVVSDGSIDAGSLAEALVDSAIQLPAPFDVSTRVTLDINLLVVEVDGLRVLFDAGAGSGARLGQAMFGASVGNATAALRATGIDPSSIDLVALTHAHPDHAWGLIDDEDRPCFPNAWIAIATDELDHWMSAPRLAAEEGELTRWIRSGARRSLCAYENRIIAADEGELVTASVTVRKASGHSPGHVAYEIASGGERLVCWGDLCHHPVLLADPALNFTFDHDPAGAVKSRMELLTGLAGTDTAVLAYHLPFPGLGRVATCSDQGYMWCPGDTRHLRYHP